MRGALGPKIGLVLARLVAPAWVLTGATFKMLEGTPKNLPPKTILATAGKLDLDLYVVLAAIIGIEFLAAAIMLLVPRVARTVAMFMMSVFCLVIIGEMVQGNVTSCGCLGAVTMPPWLMLAIDGSILLGLMAFDPSPIYPAVTRRWPMAAAVVLGAAGAAFAYKEVVPTDQGGDPVVVNPPASNGVPTPPPGNSERPNPDPRIVRSFWLASNLDKWVGKRWQELELFQYMKKWPQDMDTGVRYVVFYSRTCDHCQEMFYNDLTDPALGSMVTAIEIPADPDLLTSPDAWPMPETECELLALPLNCEWIITAPMTIAFEDGVVTCAQEGEHKKCMGLE